MDNTDTVCTPPELREEAKKVGNHLIPQKSASLYELSYKSFNDWKNSRGTKITSENVLLAYFGELKKKYKPSTRWSQYSMLKAKIQQEENINIAIY